MPDIDRPGLVSFHCQGTFSIIVSLCFLLCSNGVDGQEEVEQGAMGIRLVVFRGDFSTRSFLKVEYNLDVCT